MGRPARLASLLLLLPGCAAIPAQGLDAQPTPPDEQWLSIYLGRRGLDEDDYEPVEDQQTLGIGWARQPADSPLGWELGAFGSREEDDVSGFDVEGRTSELYGGLHKTFGGDVVRPYVGAGLAYIRTEVDVSGVGDDDDASLAGYAHGGVRIDLGETFFVGLDLRWLFGSDLELGGEDADADYGQAAITVGWSF